ncbi:MAG: hypothetical protein GOVbin630_30 [Prokaryotic dsDNA virus sp.]|nr:MAG: hypothetical protein GOVbin630_30 [Prokaryotic dsDNA virus sp.]|tara:strand:- start:21017 stop:21865 length:849 start_codon:yes stop_codon:yes gene_type:complete
MQTVIGLGQAGCSIADHFKQYPQYNIIKLDVGLRKTKHSFGLKPQASPELYEKNLPRGIVKYLQEGVMSQTLFITSCGMVSGASLSLLSKIKDRSEITLMYIIPDSRGVAGVKKLQNNLLFNVFQEYARSALFRRIYLLDNKRLSNIIGPVPILKRWNTINNLISSTYHMINVFEHTQPVLTTTTSRIDTARISTLGVLDMKNNEEKMFFELDIPREKNYYYGVPNKQLEEDENLMEVIHQNLKTNTEHDKMKTTYSVYSTDYDKPIAYCEKSSTLIQKLAF